MRIGIPSPCMCVFAFVYVTSSEWDPWNVVYSKLLRNQALRIQMNVAGNVHFAHFERNGPDWRSSTIYNNKIFNVTATILSYVIGRSEVRDAGTIRRMTESGKLRRCFEIRCCCAVGNWGSSFGMVERVFVWRNVGLVVVLVGPSLFIYREEVDFSLL